MQINLIATRFDNRADPEPGDVSLNHIYRQRWWLPIIGPTASCILSHLSSDNMSSDWRLTPATEMATALGLGKSCSTNSPLIRSLIRLTRFGFGHFDIEPGQANSDPCITIYRTVHLVPDPATRNWPEALQQDHAIALAGIYRQAG